MSFGRSAAAVAILTAGALVAAPLARAAEAGAEIIVRLHAGAVYRGQLVELVPHDHVTVKLATGEIKRFADAEVARVENAGGDLPGAPPAPGPVYVELESTRPEAALIRVSPTAGGLDANFNGTAAGSVNAETICVAPCRRPVLPGRFVVGGPGLRDSPRFDITGRNPRVKVWAEPGSEGRLTGGIVLGGLGALAAALGFVMLPLALAGQEQEQGPYARPESPFKNLLPVSAGLMLVGVVAGAVGLSMAINSQSKVDLAPLR